MKNVREMVRHNGVFWRKFAYLGCVYGPEWWKTYSPGPIGLILYAILKSGRRAVTRNMQRVLGVHDVSLTRRAAQQVYAEFARCFAETMEFYGPRPRPLVFDAPPNDALVEALRNGNGAVVVTAHLGNWDVAAKELKAYGRPLNAVMAHEANRTTHEFVRSARAAAGVRVIYSDSSVFSSLNMIRALRNNEVVAIQIDRPEGAVGTIKVPFFGAPAAFPSGPFVLARIAGAPIIPVFVPRIGRRHYAVRVGKRIDLPKEGRGGLAIERALRAVVAEFEAIVREFPTQWFHFGPFWEEDIEVMAGGSEASPTERKQARG